MCRNRERSRKQKTRIKPSPALEPYQHEALNSAKAEVRLFKIQRSNCENDDRINGTLTTFDLTEDCPPFQALSYTWGDKRRRKVVYIDGKALTIRRNLHNFLQHYQSLSSDEFKCAFPKLSASAADPCDVYLWIDQLSIDQDNVAERNHQVRMMKMIYTRAEEVVAWIGCADRRMSKKFDHFNAHDACDAHGTYDLIDWFEIRGLIACRAYWRRLWIVQELMVAQDIKLMCGRKFIPWIRLDEKAFSRYKTMTWLFRCRQAIQDKSISFTHILAKFCVQACTDPRDKVYGLIGLLGDGEGIIPDYERAVEDVFNDAVRLMVRLKIGPQDINVSKAAVRGMYAGPLLEVVKLLHSQMGLKKIRTERNGLKSHPNCKAFLKVVWSEETGMCLHCLSRGDMKEDSCRIFKEEVRSVLRVLQNNRKYVQELG